MFHAQCLYTIVQTAPKHLLPGDTWLYILGMFTRKRQAKLVLKPKLGQRSAAVKNCSRQSKLLRKLECHVHRRQECLAYPIAHSRHNVNGTYNHPNELPFKCSVCEKGFSVAYYLKLHEDTHSNEVPFHCKFCDKGFKQKCNMTKHERTCKAAKDFSDS